MSAQRRMLFRPKIGRGDFDSKRRKITEWLTEGDAVDVTVSFRGREVQFPELGTRIFDQLRRDIPGVVIGPLRRESGRHIAATLTLPQQPPPLASVPAPRNPSPSTLPALAAATPLPETEPGEGE